MVRTRGAFAAARDDEGLSPTVDVAVVPKLFVDFQLGVERHPGEGATRLPGEPGQDGVEGSGGAAAAAGRVVDTAVEVALAVTIRTKLKRGGGGDYNLKDSKV